MKIAPLHRFSSGGQHNPLTWAVVGYRSGKELDETTSYEDYIKDLLSLPGPMKVESIVAIGYPGEKREPVPKEELKYEKIRLNDY